jgi:hypothetical protein
MAAEAKRVREQAVVYLAERDRALLEELVRESGLSRAELFRRGLWALAKQMRGTAQTSAFEELIAGAADFQGPPDYSEHADDYLYGGKPLLNRVAEDSTGSSAPSADSGPASKQRGKRARPR